MSPKYVPSLFSRETSLYPLRCFVELQIISIVWALYKYNKWLATSSYFHIPWNGDRSPLFVLSFALGIQSDTHRYPKMFSTTKVTIDYSIPIYIQHLFVFSPTSCHRCWRWRCANCVDMFVGWRLYVEMLILDLYLQVCLCSHFDHFLNLLELFDVQYEQLHYCGVP
jgi:hypothetical protein